MAKSKKDFSNQAKGMGFNAWFQKTDEAEGAEQRVGEEQQPEEQVEEVEQAQQKAPIKKTSRDRRVKAVAEKPASEKGCKAGDTRKTFIIRKDLAEQIQDVAYWEPGKLKDHVNAALEAYVEKKWTKKRPKGA